MQTPAITQLPTNANGAEHLQTWLKGEILEVYELEGKENHFFISTSSGTAHALPYANSGCSASHFGSNDYLRDYLNGKTKWQQLIGGPHAAKKEFTAKSLSYFLTHP
jgi:hypothetical protein